MSEGDTLTRADLAESVHKSIGLSRTECAAMIEAMLRHMCDSLGRGESVKITGFGTFTVRHKNERVGRNPKTGIEVPIPARKVISFRPSLGVRARMETS